MVTQATRRVAIALFAGLAWTGRAHAFTLSGLTYGYPSPPIPGLQVTTKFDVEGSTFTLDQSIKASNLSDCALASECSSTSVDTHAVGTIGGLNIDTSDLASYNFITVSVGLSSTNATQHFVSDVTPNDGDPPTHQDMTYYGSLSGQVLIPFYFDGTGYTYFNIGSLDFTSQDLPDGIYGYFTLGEASLDLTAVPLPASAPLFGAALLTVGAAGFGARRRMRAFTDAQRTR